MSNGVTTDRLVMLRQRWESDPTSRIFLQLAEEHRHLGQIQEALAVLDRGLQEHPGYLSALVAKGRCHLELGEPAAARTVLERVLKQDATQMVANKLLVRAHLETGEPARARERLDLYRLLNDSDPEIEVLRRRIQAMDQPSKPSIPEESREAAAVEPSPVFPDLLAPLPREKPLDSSDIFGLTGGPAAAIGTEAPAFEPLERQPFVEPPVFAPAPVAVGSPSPRPVSVPGGADDVFPDLHAGRARDRYLARLSAEGLFPLPAPPTPPAPPAPIPSQELPSLPETVEAPTPPITERFVFTPPEPERIEPPVAAEPEPVAAWEEPELLLPDLEPEAQEAVPVAFDLAPPAEARPLVELRSWNLDAEEPTLEETAAAEGYAAARAPEPVEVPQSPQAPLAPVTPLATITLAEIYVQQGHPAEAERIYREVLRREPGNTAAQAGFDRLARMERRLRPLEARDLLSDDSAAFGEGDSSRLRHMLQSYLQRIRERSQRDVS